ncbi:hypothetical protein PhCBS80983_g00149 [Powellomyces hirtus]|uniref:Xylanolytic transcriptional activator regulatory domain-containing protein n=1 Tax=Powellomyces hirtus TaxID=109895 RepID=A0A507EI61_9FUNG|nr:hypothetical protein PhCBS80983_g00149 [Powellomyces hirtus]
MASHQPQGHFAGNGHGLSGDDLSTHDRDEDDHHDHEDDDDDEDDREDGFEDGPAGIKRKRVTQACDACNKKKRGPRAGYIESLENRLKEMEALLKPSNGTDGPSDTMDDIGWSMSADSPPPSANNPYNIRPGDPMATDNSNDLDGSGASHTSPTNLSGGSFPYSHLMNLSMSNAPNVQQQQQNRNYIPPEATNELIELFFLYISPILPLVHKPTFYANMSSHSPLMLNSIYALAARFSNHPSIRTDSVYSAGDVFYIKAREMVDHYMDVPNASTVSALLILANYAAESGRGSAAWMYSGMAIRMAQELKLNVEPDLEDTFAGGSRMTWLEKESRRRLWWNCFVLDRYAGAAADRSMIINEKDCKVYLPATELDWENETGPGAVACGLPPNDTYQIAVLTSTNTFTPGMPSQSPYGYFVLLVKIFGKILEYSNVLKSTQRTNVTPALTPDADYQLTVLDASLRDWFSSLPDHMHNFGSENATGSAAGPMPSWPTAYLHIFYHLCVIMLHRPKMMIGVRDPQDAGAPPELLQNPAFVVCLSSANAIAKVIGIVSETNPHFLHISPFVGFCIFQSGLVHLLASQLGGRSNYTSPGTTKSRQWTDSQLSTVRSQAEHNVTAHLAALQGVSRFWYMPSRLHSMLKNLAVGSRVDVVTRAILGVTNHHVSDQSWVALKERYPVDQLTTAGISSLSPASAPSPMPPPATSSPASHPSGKHSQQQQQQQTKQKQQQQQQKRTSMSANLIQSAIQQSTQHYTFPNANTTGPIGSMAMPSTSRGIQPQPAPSYAQLDASPQLQAQQQFLQHNRATPLGRMFASGEYTYVDPPQTSQQPSWAASALANNMQTGIADQQTPQPSTYIRNHSTPHTYSSHQLQQQPLLMFQQQQQQQPQAGLAFPLGYDGLSQQFTMQPQPPPQQQEQQQQHQLHARQQPATSRPTPGMSGGARPPW